MTSLALKVLVGSRAHGLAREDSDYDFRVVFVQSASDLLSLAARPKQTLWLEGDPSSPRDKDRLLYLGDSRDTEQGL